MKTRVKNKTIRNIDELRLPGVPMDLTVSYPFTILWGRTSKRNNGPHAPVDGLTRAGPQTTTRHLPPAGHKKNKLKLRIIRKPTRTQDTHRDFYVHRLLETMTILVIINCNGDEDHERHSS